VIRAVPSETLLLMPCTKLAQSELPTLGGIVPLFRESASSIRLDFQPSTLDNLRVSICNGIPDAKRTNSRISTPSHLSLKLVLHANGMER
jgi:hypothetical protein